MQIAMQIDWNHFTPWTSLAGGVLIGIAAAMFLLLNGRVAGISGIVGGLLRPAAGDVAWRIAFVVGLVAGAGRRGSLEPGRLRVELPRDPELLRDPLRQRLDPEHLGRPVPGARPA